MSIGYAYALEEYSNNFNTDYSSSWIAITSDIWQIVDGKVSSTGDRPGLIFTKFNDDQYLSEIDLTASDTKVQNFAQLGFNFYYKDSDNFARVVIVDDNRGKDRSDEIKLESKGSFFVNTLTYINTSSNTTIEFEPNLMHHIKVIRLNKKIYIYYDKRLALTTEFKDENPKGKVGLDIYASTGYFDNFYLRPIEMKNASGYFNELNLTTANPSARLGEYTLRLEGIDTGQAVFSLSKFNRTVDSTIALEGGRISLKFENGDEGVNFKLAKAFFGTTDSRAELEEVIYASSEDVNLGVTDLTIMPSYYQGENMTVNFSISNPSVIAYNGTPALTINSEGGTVTQKPEIILGANQSKNFSAVLKAAQNPGAHKLTVTMKLDEYTTVTKSKDYQVRALNPVITTLSADLREDNGLRGAVTLGSAYPDELVDWNTTARVEVFNVMENGKERVYFKEIPVIKKTFDLGISYGEFYRESGRYYVAITAGEMKTDRFFEIKGPGGVYNPVSKVIPPTVVSNSLYPQLMMLLIGMVAAMSVRNHMHPRSWSLPLDLTAVGSGAVLFAAGMWQHNTELTGKGMILAGAGFGLILAREYDSRINTLLARGSHIHDFIGLVLIFMSASYLILLIPEWNFMLTVGTLIVYYTVINLHGERKKE